MMLFCQNQITPYKLNMVPAALAAGLNTNMNVKSQYYLDITQYTYIRFLRITIEMKMYHF